MKQEVDHRDRMIRVEVSDVLFLEGEPVDDRTNMRTEEEQIMQEVEERSNF